MKRIAILGSTGSIGRNALEVIKKFPNKFSLVALTANSDIQTLSAQVNKFHPKIAAIANVKKFTQLKTNLRKKTKLYCGQEAISEIASLKDVDVIVLAIGGSAALFPLLSAIRQGKTILLANKEALVMAGSIIIKQARKYRAKIIPIDSEQSAIWQCLEGQDRSKIKKIYLTASGGPLYDLARDKFKNVTVENVLRHPCWNMGRKISVDSATLMNKGLELIEARWLFDVDISQIEVLIHREAIIHSLVEFIDGAVLAQLSVTDMRIPIQYALSYPERWNTAVSYLDFSKIKYFSFARPDFNKFPCLRFAYEVAQRGGSMPCVLNAANEEAVAAFLRERIRFIDIPGIVSGVLGKHRVLKNPELTQTLTADNWARQKAQEFICRNRTR